MLARFSHYYNHRFFRLTTLNSKNNNDVYSGLLDLTLGKDYFTSTPALKHKEDKMLPIGYDNFREIIDNKLDFIDKSLFIKEVLNDRGTKVAVITRPRRFGKTTNLSMLHHFLSAEVRGQPTKGLFDTLKIMDAGEEYMRHQGRYPVIFLTFKDIKENNFDLAYEKICELIIETYDQHAYILDNPRLSYNQKRLAEAFLKGTPSRAQVSNSLKILCECLTVHHGIKPWILIDEYDTPIQVAYIQEHLNANDSGSKGYYKEMTALMRGIFGTALKSNDYLNRAVITGILRVAKESLFSGLNNIDVYSLLRSEYSQYFGFTDEEVDGILRRSNLSQEAEKIKSWYNGYNVGGTTIYNPWSIANCIRQKGAIKPYWINTSDNQLIKDLLKRTTLDFKQGFRQLIDDQPIKRIIDESLVFDHLERNPTAIWNLLYASGYLIARKPEQTEQGTLCELAIPNQEVFSLYRQIVEQWLSNSYGVEWYNVFIQSLLTGDVQNFKSHLNSVLLQIASYHDLAKEPEAFFHGLLLGFSASLHGAGTYEIKSNRESAKGRFDILLIPKDIKKLGILIELKNNKDEKVSLVKLAEEAIQQIDKNNYVEEFKIRGVTKVVKLGIGFRGKACEVLGEHEELMNSSTKQVKNI